MSIQSSLFTALSSAFSTRLYPLVAPNTPVRPFGVYQRIASVPSSIHGSSGLYETRMQIDVYADTYAAALTLAASAQTAIEATASLISSHISSIDEYEPDTKLYRVILEFTFWHT